MESQKYSWLNGNYETNKVFVENYELDYKNHANILGNRKLGLKYSFSTLSSKSN